MKPSHCQSRSFTFSLPSIVKKPERSLPKCIQKRKKKENFPDFQSFFITRSKLVLNVKDPFSYAQNFHRMQAPDVGVSRKVSEENIFCEKLKKAHFSHALIPLTPMSK
jgi:hypothetical protein